MCRIFKDIDGKQYSLSEAIKVVPNGHKCYRKYHNEKGEIVTELCPFLDWVQQNEFIKEEDFEGSGFCHLLMNADWSHPEYGKDIEHIQLARANFQVRFNSKKEGTIGLWDCKKNCQINLLEEDSDKISE